MDFLPTCYYELVCQSASFVRCYYTGCPSLCWPLVSSEQEVNVLRLAPYDGYFYGSYGLQNFKLSGAQLPHVLVPQNNFKDVFNNTCDIGDFRAHLFCPQTTEELPKKHHEAELPTNALSKIDYGHSRHREDCKEACFCQRITQRALCKIRLEDEHPIIQNAPLPLHFTH